MFRIEKREANIKPKPKTKYGMNPTAYAFCEQVGSLKARYFIILEVILWTLLAVIGGSLSILDAVEHGQADVNSLALMKIRFASAADASLAFGAVLALSIVVLTFAVMIPIARHLKNTRGVSLG